MKISEERPWEKRACDCPPWAGENSGPIGHLLLCPSRPNREERIALRKERCDDGDHEDPDWTGLCIHCGKVLYGDSEDDDPGGTS